MPTSTDRTDRRDLDTFLHDVGRRIAALRRARGWTQADMAERLGVAVQNAQRLEG
ncbi:MAG: helix-turn-helix transcriptional regulator [Deltaproteobacteria bacterium]|nr:helix-turn-helix transcriptional regulator [Deltaproteobacteria bacterium]